VNVNSLHGKPPAAHPARNSCTANENAGHGDVAQIKNDIKIATAAIEVTLENMVTSRSCDLAQCLAVVGTIRNTLDTSPEIFIQLTRLKLGDEITFAHSLSVSALMLQLGLSLGLEARELSELGVAGIVHDVGKLLIPQEILQKPSALTASELATMRNHPIVGYELLKGNPQLPEVVLDVCRHHHEHIDGSGYPDGLSGRSVSRASRIAAICDVFDALTTARSYKAAWTEQDAIRWMFNQEGKFDRKLLLRFADAIDFR
jgi:HD-GYP domain-containing protein (c-di-GMP phosphodiesterase class II)